MADCGDRLAGIVEGFDQGDRIGIIDKIPHRPMAAYVENGVEIFRLHVGKLECLG